MASKPPFEMPEGDYAGDVTCQEAWDKLASDSTAILIDVRTQIEWQLIGKPDLGSINKEPLYLQWVTMQGMNENFIEELQAALDERGATKDTPLYFMCQSGGRSKMSAMQLTKLGYSQCFNLAEGFEGELDEHQHRNSLSGWKVAGLPWMQS
jgi:rhodanese-related sulfurtransferase